MFSKKVKLAKQQIATSAQRSETIKKKLSSLAKSNNLFPASKKPYSSNSNGFSDSNTNTSASLVKREETSDTTNEYEPKKKEPLVPYTDLFVFMIDTVVPIYTECLKLYLFFHRIFHPLWNPRSRE